MTVWVRRKASSSTLFHLSAAAWLFMSARPADASVATAASLEEITRDSTSVAIVTALDARTEWQGRRIVTYHRLRIESVVSGNSTGAEVVVKTLGGRLGRLAQVVDGEPAFTSGERSLVFLRADAAGSVRVTRRAQGQLRVRPRSDGNYALFRNHHPGKLLGAARTAVARPSGATALDLDGMSLDEGVTRITAAWRRIHAR